MMVTDLQDSIHLSGGIFDLSEVPETGYLLFVRRSIRMLPARKSAVLHSVGLSKTALGVRMKRILVASVVVTALFAVAAQAQTTTPPPPGAEVKKLGAFVGTWTGEGKSETSPFGKGGVIKSTMTCGWYTGGYQLICDSDDSGPMGKIKSHGIYGYRVDKKQYFSFGIDSSGFGGPGTVKVDGSTWTFEGNDTMGGKPFWFRTVVRLTSPSELDFKSEYSEDGKTWKQQSEGKMTKKG